jgi:hypothetical protein
MGFRPLCRRVSQDVVEALFLSPHGFGNFSVHKDGDGFFTWNFVGLFGGFIPSYRTSRSGGCA